MEIEAETIASQLLKFDAALGVARHNGNALNVGANIHVHF